MLIQPDLSAVRKDRTIDLVVRAMIALKQSRYKKKITRKQFLDRWRGLRTVMGWTPEYQLMRRIVFKRDKRCTKCQGPAEHPHHKIRVVDNPRRACDPSNVIALCEACHRRTHLPSRTTPPVHQRNAPPPLSRFVHTHSPLLVRAQASTHQG
jgi:hypothetical protein